MNDRVARSHDQGHLHHLGDAGSVISRSREIDPLLTQKVSKRADEDRRPSVNDCLRELSLCGHWPPPFVAAEEPDRTRSE